MPPTRPASPARPASPSPQHRPASPHRPAAPSLPMPDTGGDLIPRGHQFSTVPRSVSSRRARTLPAPTPPTPPPNAPYKGARPADLRECLTRHVFPVASRPPTLPDGTQPFTMIGSDVDLAIAQAQFHTHQTSPNHEQPRKVRVQYHAHIVGLLFDEMQRVKARPGPGVSEIDYTKRVSDWHADNEIIASYPCENEKAGLFDVVVEHVNEFLAVRRNYEPTRAPVTTAGWMRPSELDASSKGDWLCYSDEKPRAALKVKPLLVDRDLDQIFDAAMAEQAHKVAGTIPLSNGFEVWVNGENRVCNSCTLGGNAAKACLVVRSCWVRTLPANADTRPPGLVRLALLPYPLDGAVQRSPRNRVLPRQAGHAVRVEHHPPRRGIVPRRAYADADVVCARDHRPQAKHHHVERGAQVLSVPGIGEARRRRVESS